jgi:Mlc titration factor MtfA (ptsG expression regulator)
VTVPARKRRPRGRRSFPERLHRSRRARWLRRRRIPFARWHRAVLRLPSLRRLPAPQRRRLRQLAGRFLAEKTISGAGGQVVDDSMAVAIAAQACLPILELGLDAYRGWKEIIVYPDTFLVEHEEMDEAGVLHSSRRELAGESWERGPVILSWGDIAPDAPAGHFDGAIILHEFAHKLDMLNDGPNGMPLLHRDMAPADWTAAFSEAYAALCDAVDAGHDTLIDPYATESPAEFFAVCSEVFFEDPRLLRTQFPAVYGQLARYYRQDPAAGGQRD